MAEYEFGNNSNVNPQNSKFQVQAPSIGVHRTGQNVPKEPNPIQPSSLPSKTKEHNLFEDNVNINISEEIQSILPKGFYTFDRGIKNYFSGIRIPTNDDARIMSVRISGGDKSFLVWFQDMKRGRIKLPIMSINRSGVNYNENKYSYPYLPMNRRYNDDGTKITYTYRPVPYFIDYELSIWAEHKRDAEYALYQIMTRFNPMAEFKIQDEYIIGNVQLLFKGQTDDSDIESDAETRANVRYTISCQMEAWLPLNEKTVPTVLGDITTLKESDSNEVYFRMDTSNPPRRR